MISFIVLQTLSSESLSFLKSRFPTHGFMIIAKFLLFSLKTFKVFVKVLDNLTGSITGYI